MQLKRTPLYELHRSSGAKLVGFAGFEMPVQYQGLIDEHRAVRNGVGLFDVSHMGEIEIRGTGAAEFVQKLTTNDVSKLTGGKVQYSAMCDDSGGIIDDLLVYHMGSHFMLVVNAGNIAGDAAWIREQADGDVVISDVSDQTALIAVQGPASRSLLQKLTDTDLSPLQYYRSTRATVAGVDLVLSRTGYTGELGFELYFPALRPVAEGLWSALLRAGEEFGACPVGLGARDTLRLEMGFCLYGNDIDRTTHPLEAGLGWITKIDKGDFVGRNAIVRAKEAGLTRKLTGFVVREKAVPRKGYEIRSGGEGVGVVTSGTFSPTLEQGIGMGYIASHATAAGSLLQIVIRGKEVPAEVVTLPFVHQEKH